MRSGVKTILSSLLLPRSVRFVTDDPLILQKKMMMILTKLIIISVTMTKG